MMVTFTKFLVIKMVANVLSLSSLSMLIALSCSVRSSDNSERSEGDKLK